MRRTYLRALRLSVRFAQLGGMAGIAVFLSQGEFVKALWCAVTAALCILILSLAMALGESLNRRF